MFGQKISRNPCFYYKIIIDPVQFTMKHTHIHSYKVENLIQNLHIPRRKAKNKLDGHISAGGNHLEEQ